MSSQQPRFNLLNPFPALQGHYIHQLTQTIHVYSATQIVIGEVLQNAIDALVEAGKPNGLVKIRLDFDRRTVTVRDYGPGFPNDPQLLFLGGSRKRIPSKKMFGLVGVGLKVVLFSSEFFQIRSRTKDGSFRYSVEDAYLYERDPPPKLDVDDVFPPDPKSLDKPGTEIQYRFPRGATRDLMLEFTDEIIDRCLPDGVGESFGKTLAFAVEQGTFESRFAGLLEAFFRRFTYSGDVLNRLGEKPELLTGAQRRSSSNDS